jgi:hypothetical protein
MPDVPLGIVSVTLVSSGKAWDGVKVAVLPLIFQEPGVDGEIFGSGVPDDSGAEKPTVIGLAPLTLFELEPGVTEVTSIAGAGVTVGEALGVALSWREDATDVVFTVVWAGLTASTTRPAMSTSAAATPVTTRDLLDTPSPRSLEQTELHQDQ